MVKKLKAMAAAKQGKDTQLSDQIRDSAQQIWLAGLGAFSKARADRTKAFETLVKEGKSIQLRTRAMAEERIGEVTGRVNEVREKMSKQATESWDKLEQVFEERVSRALGRLGVPTSKDVKGLMKRVDELTASVQAMSGKAPAPRKAAAKPAARKPAKAAARKAGPKAAAKPAPKAAARPAAKRAAKAGAKRAAKPAAKPAPTPVEQAAEKPAAE
jgi:poly(hydroxyalkanoate) granule-associated protein